VADLQIKCVVNSTLLWIACEQGADEMLAIHRAQPDPLEIVGPQHLTLAMLWQQ
jgi:hypothetical protein